MYPHNKYAPTSVSAPEPVGLCRRCGFLYPISSLVEQYEWRGPALQKILTRVCVRTCLDVPNETLRTIVISADPVPPKDPSPTFYAQQNAALAPLTDEADPFILDDSSLDGSDVLS